MQSTQAGIPGNLREWLSRGQPIIGAGSGFGNPARCEEAGSVRLTGIRESGRRRMAGRGSPSSSKPVALRRGGPTASGSRSRIKESQRVPLRTLTRG
ncbi:TIM-barrel signal transduction protein [Tautonia plasticadhaerens]|uniref:TIM-barrel signal transduction protein n=1 Tax=Tautonia plasticadhaerens TaxID=2527974 RepID=A0A518HA84_9BACT|nr:TIM-barrel signal transduction protein [Tautonia plasticadhaerens]